MRVSIHNHQDKTPIVIPLVTRPTHQALSVMELTARVSPNSGTDHTHMPRTYRAAGTIRSWLRGNPNPREQEKHPLPGNFGNQSPAQKKRPAKRRLKTPVGSSQNPDPSPHRDFTPALWGSPATSSSVCITIIRSYRHPRQRPILQMRNVISRPHPCTLLHKPT